MRGKTTLVLTLALFVAAMFVMAGAEEVKHTYVGADKCKMCHKKDGTYESWLTTKHATAWDGLTDEQKKDEAFKKFYTTGSDEKGVLLTGVQCEACHGAGSDYKKMSIMKDKKLAIENGLIIPDEATCKTCHNEKAPGALGASAKDFNFAKMKAKGVHAMPAPAKEEKK